MCHAVGGAGLRLAVEAGVDSIEHGCYLDEDPELLAMMAERGIFFVPTLTVYEYHRESPWAHVRERARALHAHHLESVRRAQALGVKVVAGTDAGGHGHPANALELRYLVEAGLSPMQALQRPPGSPPSAWGSNGTSGPSKRASRPTWSWWTAIPWRISACSKTSRRIRLVMKGGVTVPR